MTQSPLPPALIAPGPLPPEALRGRPLRLIGDVHGTLSQFAPVVEEALAAGRLVVQLGDLVDYGRDNPGCLRLMRQLIADGCGTMLPGNHDDKYWRHLSGREVDTQTGLHQTISQMAEAPDRRDLEAFVGALVPALPLWLDLGGLILVHAAWGPRMRGPAPRLRDVSLPGAPGRSLRAVALYGETSGQRRADGYPLRTYGWVDQVPAGHVVVIGHDVRSTHGPVTLVNAQGGRAVLLDTGCGKGGVLSWLDVDPLPADAGTATSRWRFTPALETLAPALVDA